MGQGHTIPPVVGLCGSGEHMRERGQSAVVLVARGVGPHETESEIEILSNTTERLDEGGTVDGIVTISVDIGEDLVNGATCGGGCAVVIVGILELFGLSLRGGGGLCVVQVDVGRSVPSGGVLVGVEVGQVVAHGPVRRGGQDAVVVHLHDLVTAGTEKLGLLVKSHGALAQAIQIPGRPRGIGGLLDPGDRIEVNGTGVSYFLPDNIHTVAQVTHIGDQVRHGPGVEADEGHD